MTQRAYRQRARERNHQFADVSTGEYNPLVDAPEEAPVVVKVKAPEIIRCKHCQGEIEELDNLPGEFVHKGKQRAMCSTNRLDPRPRFAEPA